MTMMMMRKMKMERLKQKHGGWREGGWQGRGWVMKIGIGLCEVWEWLTTAGRQTTNGSAGACS